MVGHEVGLVEQVAADQLTVGGVAAQQPTAMPQDLPEQGFADRAQVDQVDRAAGAFCQSFDQGDLLRSAECAASAHSDVEIALRMRLTRAFLQRKEAEFEQLRHTIAALKSELVDVGKRDAA